MKTEMHNLSKQIKTNQFPWLKDHITNVWTQFNNIYVMSWKKVFLWEEPRLH